MPSKTSTSQNSTQKTKPAKSGGKPPSASKRRKINKPNCQTDGSASQQQAVQVDEQIFAPEPNTPQHETWPSAPNPVLEVPGSGKLGKIAATVASDQGATMEELVEASGWQRHTIRAALSRLRKRGMPIILAERDGRKAYRVA